MPAALLAAALAWVGAWWARRLRVAVVSTLLVAVLAGWLATGPAVRVSEPLARDVCVLACGAPAGDHAAELAALRDRLLPASRPGLDHARVKAVAPAELAAALVRRTLAADDLPRRTVVALTGPAPEPGALPQDAGAWLTTLAPRCPLAPEAFTLELPPVLVAGRPARIGVRVPARTAPATVALHSALGDATAEVPAGAAQRVEFQVLPRRAGRVALQAELRLDPWRLTRGADVVVQAAPRLLGLGLDAQLLAALRAQGLVVDTALDPASPGSAEIAAWVVARPLAAAEAERAAAFVDAGGGLLALGSTQGLLGPAAAALLPVAVRELPSGDAPGAGAGAGAGDQPQPPVATPPAPPPPESQPVAPPSSRPAPAAGAPPGPVPASAPVRPRQKRLARKVAMAFVIDRSGSMTEPIGLGGATRFEMALASARDSARALAADDQLALIAFAGKPELLVPLTRVADAGFEAVLSQVWVGGSTRVTGALEMARAELRKSDAPSRHVVLFTDGEFAEEFVPPVVEQLQAEGISVSGVAIAGELIGNSTFRVLEAMTRVARGRYLQNSDPRAIGRFLAAEVEHVLGNGPAMAGAVAEAGTDAPAPTAAAGAVPASAASAPATPGPARSEPVAGPAPSAAPPASRPAPAPLTVHRVAESPMLAGLPATGPLPAVARVIAAAARPGAQVLLAAGPEGLPLLASWNFGLGRVTTWCSALRPEWAPEWLALPSLSALLAQWVTDLLPPPPRMGAPRCVEGTVELPAALAAPLDAPARGLDAAGQPVALRWRDPWRLAADAPVLQVLLAGEPAVDPAPAAAIQAATLVPNGVPEAHQERLARRLGGRGAAPDQVPALLPATRLVSLPLSWLVAAAGCLAVALALARERRALRTRG